MVVTYHSSLMMFMMKLSPNQNKSNVFLKISLNQKFCHLLTPKLSWLPLLPSWRHAAASSACLFLISFVPAACSWSKFQFTDFDLFFLHFFGSDLKAQGPRKAIFHPEWGLKRKTWRHGCFSSRDFKQFHLPNPRTPHSSQSLLRFISLHMYLQNS